MTNPLTLIPPDLVISIKDDLPRGVTATTDGKRVIWLARGLTQVQTKCAIHHELVHIKYGHTEHQSWKIERRVKAETARNLIDLHAMHEAWKRSLSIEEMAAELSVTITVLMDRLDALTYAEARYLFDLAMVHYETIGA